MNQLVQEIIDESEGGRKNDEGKPDYSLVPPHALEQLTRVLTYGADKYDRNNWKKVPNAKSRYFAATQRHIWAVMKGEECDPDTGIHHYAHALASLMFLIELDYVQTDENSV